MPMSRHCEAATACLCLGIVRQQLRAYVQALLGNNCMPISGHCEVASSCLCLGIVRQQLHAYI